MKSLSLENDYIVLQDHEIFTAEEVSAEWDMNYTSNKLWNNNKADWPRQFYVFTVKQREADNNGHQSNLITHRISLQHL